MQDEFTKATHRIMRVVNAGGGWLRGLEGILCENPTPCRVRCDN